MNLDHTSSALTSVPFPLLLSGHVTSYRMAMMDVSLRRRGRTAVVSPLQLKYRDYHTSFLLPYLNPDIYIAFCIPLSFGVSIKHHHLKHLPVQMRRRLKTRTATSNPTQVSNPTTTTMVVSESQFEVSILIVLHKTKLSDVVFPSNQSIQMI